MITLARIETEVTAFLLDHPLNLVQAQDAIRPDLVGMRIYDAPVFAVGAADDPLFAALRGPGAIHPDYPLPGDWVDGAQSVISFFAPFTQRVRQANARRLDAPADEWQHARYEGEVVLALARRHLRDMLIAEGYQAVAPQHDPRYKMLAPYAPNWAERHTGYVCGLGTFGLSKGLITQKGVAGRLGSVVTDCALPVTQRGYTGLYDYCNGCNLCARHCPTSAIDPARGLHAGKAHPPCDAYLAQMRAQPGKGASRRQRYGCGKCQVGVPCEAGIPAGRA